VRRMWAEFAKLTQGSLDGLVCNAGTLQWQPALALQCLALTRCVDVLARVAGRSRCAV
jgi:hypothetical protein